MTNKVTVTVETKPVDKPAGVTPGLLRVSVLDAAGNIVSFQDVEGNIAEFKGVVDGEYLITAARIDVNGAPIGETVSQKFVVSVAPVTYESPVGFTVQVEAE